MADEPSVLSDDVGATTAQSSDPGRASALYEWMSTAMSPSGGGGAPEVTDPETPMEQKPHEVHAPPPTPIDGTVPEDTPQRSWLPWRNPSPPPRPTGAVESAGSGLLRRISESLGLATRSVEKPASPAVEGDVQAGLAEHHTQMDGPSQQQQSPEARPLSPPCLPLLHRASDAVAMEGEFATQHAASAPGGVGSAAAEAPAVVEEAEGALPRAAEGKKGRRTPNPRRSTSRSSQSSAGKRTAGRTTVSPSDNRRRYRREFFSPASPPTTKSATDTPNVFSSDVAAVEGPPPPTAKSDLERSATRESSVAHSSVGASVGKKHRRSEPQPVGGHLSDSATIAEISVALKASGGEAKKGAKKAQLLALHDALVGPPISAQWSRPRLVALAKLMHIDASMKSEELARAIETVL